MTSTVRCVSRNSSLFVFVCFVVLLQSFLVINSHLTFPHSQMYLDLRLDQIKVVLESVRDYVTRESLQDVPVVRAYSSAVYRSSGHVLIGDLSFRVQLMCGDFNDFNDPVHRLVMNQGFASVFSQLHGREAKITHCNHNNREVGVDFVFASHLQSRRNTRRRARELVVEPADPTDSHARTLIEDEEDEEHGDVDASSQMLQLVPTACHLSPRKLTDETRLKRPSFGHDWRKVPHPQDHHDEEALVDYWRMVSDHRPLVATFEVLPPLSSSPSRLIWP